LLLPAINIGDYAFFKCTFHPFSGVSMIEDRSTNLLQNQNPLAAANNPLTPQDPYALGLNTAKTATALSRTATTYFGDGNDVIDLGNGNSLVNAGNGDNVVLGGLGNDVIYTGSGRDIIEAGEGRNTINAGEGVNLITSGAGNDYIISGGSGDFINAGDGRNTVFAGNGNNHILTGKGRDLIYAGDGDDRIYSGAGDDIIYGGNGNNIINAGTGKDTVYLGSGVDKVILGAGQGDVTLYGFDTAVDKLVQGEGLRGRSLTFTSRGGDTLVKSGRDLVATLKGVTAGSQALIDNGPLYRYAATDLGSLSANPNSAVTATAINDFGQIAGRYDTGETIASTNGNTGLPQTITVRSGFVWENGTQTALPSTGVKNGPPDFGAADGAFGAPDGSTIKLLTPNVNTISERGVVFGTADELRVPVTKATDRALVWEKGGSGYNLTINDLGGIESYYLDANTRHQIAGRQIVSRYDTQGGAYTFEKPLYVENGVDNGGANRAVSELATLGGNGGTAQSLNGNGTVVGYLDSDGVLDGSEKYTAAVWKRDAKGAFVLSDLGTFGAEQARLVDINNAGAIVGASNSGSGATATSTPFLLRDGQFTALGSLGGKTGSVNAINEFGEVVGASQIAAGTNHAYVWHEGVQGDLNNLVTRPITYNGAAVTLTNAVGVNNFGDIVATGTYSYKDPVTNANATGTRSFLLKTA
jgi:probable HAF family extracellular repeat protein